jgi:hypothetical protein
MLEASIMLLTFPLKKNIHLSKKKNVYFIQKRFVGGPKSPSTPLGKPPTGKTPSTPSTQGQKTSPENPTDSLKDFKPIDVVTPIKDPTKSDPEFYTTIPQTQPIKKIQDEDQGFHATKNLETMKTHQKQAATLAAKRQQQAQSPTDETQPEKQTPEKQTPETQQPRGSTDITENLNPFQEEISKPINLDEENAEDEEKEREKKAQQSLKQETQQHPENQQRFPQPSQTQPQETQPSTNPTNNNYYGLPLIINPSKTSGLTVGISSNINGSKPSNKFPDFKVPSNTQQQNEVQTQEEQKSHIATDSAPKVHPDPNAKTQESEKPNSQSPEFKNVKPQSQEFQNQVFETTPNTPHPSSKVVQDHNTQIDDFLNHQVDKTHRTKEAEDAHLARLKEEQQNKNDDDAAVRKVMDSLEKHNLVEYATAACSGGGSEKGSPRLSVKGREMAKELKLTPKARLKIPIENIDKDDTTLNRAPKNSPVEDLGPSTDFSITAGTIIPDESIVLETHLHIHVCIIKEPNNPDELPQIIAIFTSESGKRKGIENYTPPENLKAGSVNIMGENKNQYVVPIVPPISLQRDQFEYHPEGENYLQKPSVAIIIEDLLDITNKYHSEPYNPTNFDLSQLQLLLEYYEDTLQKDAENSAIENKTNDEE